MQHGFRRVMATPWKITNEMHRLLVLPWVRLRFASCGIRWRPGWRFYGVPVILRHRGSVMSFGAGLQLRSSVRSNPLGPNRPVILTTWQSGALLQVGDDFGMTGGTICAAERIIIGDRVAVGANSTIVDTDFHPLDPVRRSRMPADARTAPIRIEDDVFVGMNCLILKGVNVGRGSVIGAGSVVTSDVPAGTIVAGNPVKVVGRVSFESP